MASWYQSLASHNRPTAAHVWQPRNTSSVIFSKGLLNAPGENNCFLNSAVQVLWHLDVFRRSFREMGGHACMGKACIFCALKVLFTQLRYSEQQSLPPDALRKALAVAFQDEHRFQLGCMDDAAECFENILTRIHFHLAHDVKEDLCNAKHCIPHRKFAMTLIEHSVCPCGATSEPFPFTQMVHYVSCTALCVEAKKLREKYRWSKSVCFGQVLRNAGAIGDIRDCPSECGKKINIRRVLMNCPDVVAIGLVWDSDRPEKEHIVDVIQCLGTSLRMPDLFNSVVDEKAKQAALHLVGVVTYYGKHYSTFFYNTALRIWVYFDDATVKQVGPNWRDVVNRCKRGHSQPLLLLFANPDGTPVPTETAPQESRLLPGYTQIKSPTAIQPPKTHGVLNDPPSSSKVIKCQPLQPVMEYEPEYENRTMSAADQKAHKKNQENYVVEIGHDALRTIHARHNGSKSIGQSSSKPQSQRINGSSGKGGPPGKTWVQLHPEHYRKNSVEHKHRTSPVQATQLESRNASNSADAARPSNSSNRVSGLDIQNMNGGEVWNISDELKCHPLQSHTEEETDGNISLLSFKDAPKANLGASHLKDVNVESKTGATYSDLHHQYTTAGHISHPRRLERHESWSGQPSRPSSYAPKSSHSRQCIDNKHAVYRHNSFSHREMPLSQSHTVYNSVPDLQQDCGQTSSLGCEVSHKGMYGSRSVLANSFHQKSKSQFGSVPNLHKNLDLKSNNLKAGKDSLIDGNKSISVQNITLAAEGILADAIKNQMQQKRTSTSDVSTYRRDSDGSNHSLRSSHTLQVPSGMMSGQESVLGSVSGPRIHTVTDTTTEPKTQNTGDIQPSRYKQLNNVKQEVVARTNCDEGRAKGSVPLVQSDQLCNEPLSSECESNTSLVEMHDTNTDNSSFSHKRTINSAPSQQFINNYSPTIGCYGLRDRDSVASRDSGYRSRDRSSASSGSVYSIEAPINRAPRIVAREEMVEESHQAFSKTPDVEAMCKEVCEECAELQARSRQMGDDGDLATALALCTATVAKLKECLKLAGICPQTRQLLHSKYNNAVLQSRNLHRRLTLLRRQDFLTPGHQDVSYDSQNQYNSPSHLIQPAKETNLINLDETSRVDRLKQQLDELYLQTPTTKQNNIMYGRQESYSAPTVTQSRAGSTHSWSPLSVPSSRNHLADTHVLTDQELCKETRKVRRGISNSNRNQNASTMSLDSNQDSHTYLSDWNVERGPVRNSGCQAVGTMEDSSEHDMCVHVDPRRSSLTATNTEAQHRHGKVEPPLRHFTAHMFKPCTSSSGAMPSASMTVVDGTQQHPHGQLETPADADSGVFLTQLQTKRTASTRVYQISSVATPRAACKAYCTVPQADATPASHPRQANQNHIVDKANALVDKNLQELTSTWGSFR